MPMVIWTVGINVGKRLYWTSTLHKNHSMCTINISVKEKNLRVLEDDIK